MIAKSVHHVSFSVRNLDASRAFYEGVLGLETIDRPEMGLPGVWYGAGNAEIHLIQKPEGADLGQAPPGVNPLANHMAFEIEDYEKVRDALVARGLEVLAPDGTRGQMWVQDPDGNVIELIVAARST